MNRSAASQHIAAGAPSRVGRSIGRVAATPGWPHGIAEAINCASSRKPGDGGPHVTACPLSVRRGEILASSVLPRLPFIEASLESGGLHAAA